MAHGDLHNLTQFRLKSSATSSAQRVRRHLPALVLLALGVATSFAVDRQASASAQRRASATFERRAHEISSTIALAFQAPVQTLYSFAGVLETLPDLEPASYGRYAEYLARSSSAIVGVHWLRPVPGAERREFERRTGCAIVDRTAGAIMPAPTRTDYLPIGLLGPWEERALCGRDRLGPSGDNALLKARDTGQVVASLLSKSELPEPTISLVQALCGGHGAPGSCAAPGRFRGFAELWIHVAPVVREATSRIDLGELVVSLYDFSGAPGEHLIFASGTARAPDVSTHKGRAAEGSAPSHSVDFHFADRWWRVAVTAAGDGAPHEDHAAAFVVAALSALMSALLVAVRSLKSLRTRLEAARQLGQYTIEGELGAGSMGTVYRARHSMLRRPTAVKLLAMDRLDAHALRRFEQEVQLTALLCHPNTISIYDFGHTQDGIFYYAMEYLAGVDLQKLVDADGPQPPGRVVHVLLQACGALEEAHAMGLIHRDVKPANLMLCVHGGVRDFLKVLDFGLVKDLRDPTVLSRDAFVGTPLYASPEAYLTPEHVDARTDLYSLGAVAFFLLAGRHVFDGARVIDVLEQHVSASPPTFATLGVHGVPSLLEELIQACLAKNKEERPASARALRHRLESLQEVAAWSEHDAHHWWQQRGGQVMTKHSSPRRSASVATHELGLGETLIDLTGPI